MRVRNFWVKTTSGYWLPDKTFIPVRTTQIGPQRIMGGVKIEIFQRTSGEPHGAQQVILGEGIANVDGKLTLRLLDPSNKVIWISESHRDGK